MQLDNVPVGHDVAGSDLLTFESGRTPHASMLEGAREILVDQMCNIRDRLPTTQRVRSGAICRFARRFGIDAHDTQVIEEPRAYFTQPVPADCGDGKRRILKARKLQQRAHPQPHLLC